MDLVQNHVKKNLYMSRHTFINQVGKEKIHHFCKLTSFLYVIFCSFMA